MSTSMPTALAGGRYQLGQLIGRGGMVSAGKHTPWPR